MGWVGGAELVATWPRGEPGPAARDSLAWELGGLRAAMQRERGALAASDRPSASPAEESAQEALAWEYAAALEAGLAAALRSLPVDPTRRAQSGSAGDSQQGEL